MREALGILMTIFSETTAYPALPPNDLVVGHLKVRHIGPPSASGIRKFEMTRFGKAGRPKCSPFHPRLALDRHGTTYSTGLYMYRPPYSEER